MRKIKQVYKIDSAGYYIEPVIIGDSCEVPLDCIKVIPPDGLYRAKWNGERWVEGLTKEEIEQAKRKEERHQQIRQLESLLEERYAAHGRLLATDADELEINEVKDEIALILAELEVLYRANIA